MKPASTDLGGLAPNERATVILQSAKSTLVSKLWRAAIGGQPHVADPVAGGPPSPAFNIFDLVNASQPEDNVHHALQSAPPAARPPANMMSTPASPADLPGARLNLGANQALAAPIAAAAARTGIPAAVLASIVSAEAAKTPDGRWDPASRNRRSTATGLTQFLSSTWTSESERKGTFLNRVAIANDWISPTGRIKQGAAAALLALRYDPTISIEAAADYAAHNLRRVKDAGVTVGDDSGRLARIAYLSHHLGVGDAITYLTGGLETARAKVLLTAQIGAREAERRIDQIGNAVAAHRNWLEDFIERKISLDRFFK